MKSVINELWQGEINIENSGIFDMSELKELMNFMTRCRDNLENTLTDEQKEIFEKYMDCRNEYDGICEREIFSYGFKLGATMMKEMLS